VIQDLNLCISAVTEVRSRFEADITKSLIATLVIAEDHRNSLHYGVDPIAIVRALRLRFFGGKKQGASTIEQQLVRTIVNRYEKTPRRKIREQALAVMLSQVFTKEELAAAYLKVAFYGSSLIGGYGIRKIRSHHLNSSDEAIIAYLKYPKPLRGFDELSRKHASRMEHIKHLLRGDVSLFLLDKNSASSHLK
jgi:penicillin-binding protein 1A